MHPLARMKAVVFHKPKDVRVDRVPDPVLEHPRDVVLRVTSTAICGSDLHVYSGMVRQDRPMVMGHELIGIVEEAGDEIRSVRRGDRVLVPFACDLGSEHPGAQAELVRVPRGANLRKVPEQLTDEQALFLTDILPTGWSAIAWAGLRGGESVAVFGCGPVGIMAQKCAWLQGAKRVFAIDTRRYRLMKAREAAGSETIDANDHDVVALLRDMTEGRGPDVCVDAVGMEADRNVFERASGALRMEHGTMKVLHECIRAVRRAGHVSVVGAYGAKGKLPIGQILEKGIRIAGGQARVQASIDELAALIVAGKLRADDVITHELPLERAAQAYDIFAKRTDNCVKVVLKPGMAMAA